MKIPLQPAYITFILYLGACLVGGECFPFSRFTMYADISPHDRGALPVFFADGLPANPTDFHAFYGIDPQKFQAPEGVACSLGYLLQERAAWVAEHPATAAGPIHITAGFDQISLVDGVIIHDVLITVEGSAWP